MIKTLAWIFGVVFTLVGILGFVPGFTTDGYLLGIFEVDTLHNIIHLLTGVVALWVAMSAPDKARLYFQVFGVIYGLVAVIGLIEGDSVLGLIMTNMADHVLHLAIAAVALWAGFFARDGRMVAAM